MAQDFVVYVLWTSGIGVDWQLLESVVYTLCFGMMEYSEVVILFRCIEVTIMCVNLLHPYHVMTTYFFSML